MREENARTSTSRRSRRYGIVREGGVAVCIDKLEMQWT